MIMLVGLPASGKSYKAQELAQEYNAEIFSSDALREELFGDVNHQADNNKLFIELHRRIKACLKSGKSAIYDACNIAYKRSMAFIQELKNIPCEKICILMATPYEECLKRNAERERKVPEEVIKRNKFKDIVPIVVFALISGFMSTVFLMGFIKIEKDIKYIIISIIMFLGFLISLRIIFDKVFNVFK